MLLGPDMEANSVFGLRAAQSTEASTAKCRMPEKVKDAIKKLPRHHIEEFLIEAAESHQSVAKSIGSLMSSLRALHELEEFAVHRQPPSNRSQKQKYPTGEGTESFFINQVSAVSTEIAAIGVSETGESVPGLVVEQSETGPITTAEPMPESEQSVTKKRRRGRPRKDEGHSILPSAATPAKGDAIITDQTGRVILITRSRTEQGPLVTRSETAIPNARGRGRPRKGEGLSILTSAATPAKGDASIIYQTGPVTLAAGSRTEKGPLLIRSETVIPNKRGRGRPRKDEGLSILTNTAAPAKGDAIFIHRTGPATLIKGSKKEHGPPITASKTITPNKRGRGRPRKDECLSNTPKGDAICFNQTGPAQEPLVTASETIVPKKRGRGRPRKDEGLPNTAKGDAIIIDQPGPVTLTKGSNKEQEPLVMASETITPNKRGRGRPRKDEGLPNTAKGDAIIINPTGPEQEPLGTASEAIVPKKRGRGRPRKSDILPIATEAAIPNGPTEVPTQELGKRQASPDPSSKPPAKRMRLSIQKLSNFDQLKQSAQGLTHSNEVGVMEVESTMDNMVEGVLGEVCSTGGVDIKYTALLTLGELLSFIYSAPDGTKSTGMRNGSAPSTLIRAMMEVAQGMSLNERMVFGASWLFRDWVDLVNGYGESGDACPDVGYLSAMFSN